MFSLYSENIRVSNQVGVVIVGVCDLYWIRTIVILWIGLGWSWSRTNSCPGVGNSRLESIVLSVACTYRLACVDWCPISTTSTPTAHSSFAFVLSSAVLHFRCSFKLIETSLQRQGAMVLQFYSWLYTCVSNCMFSYVFYSGCSDCHSPAFANGIELLLFIKRYAYLLCYIMGLMPGDNDISGKPRLVK